MNKSLLSFLLLFILLSCNRKNQSNTEQYRERCQKLTAECQPTCEEKTFRTCFIDTKLFPTGPYSLIDNCHAVHVGSLCAPCEQLFSVNFGGAMRGVSCEEFFSAIDRKNKDKSCNGCLKQFGDSPFSYF